MNTSVVTIAVLAVFGATIAQSAIQKQALDDIGNSNLEKQILEQIKKLKAELAQHDPLVVENIKTEESGYWIKVSKLVVENFSKFEITRLKIDDTSRKFDCDIKIPNIKETVGPFEIGWPNGKLYTTGDSRSSIEESIVKVSGVVDLNPPQLKKFKVAFEIKGVYVEYDEINVDSEYAEEDNGLVDKLLFKKKRRSAGPSFQ